MPLPTRRRASSGRKKRLPSGNGRLGSLISVLEGIQAANGYLSEEALREVSRKTGQPLVDIYGVATFYKSFRLAPRGRHLITVCMGTACHIRGGPAVAAEFERQLGVKAGGTTPDRAFTLEAVNCLGACAIGPVVIVDGRYFRKVGTPMVAGILRDVQNGRSRPSSASVEGSSKNP